MRQTAHELRPPAEAYWSTLETIAAGQARATSYSPGTGDYFSAELKKKPEAPMEQLAAAEVEKPSPSMYRDRQGSAPSLP